MAYEPKDNSGVLFKNDQKEKDTHPDYAGTAIIKGQQYYMNAWLKEGKKGKFFSFSFKEKDINRPAEKRPVPRTSIPEDHSDEIPFAPVGDF